MLLELVGTGWACDLGRKRPLDGPLCGAGGGSGGGQHESAASARTCARQCRIPEASLRTTCSGTPAATNVASKPSRSASGGVCKFWQRVILGCFHGHPRHGARARMGLSEGTLGRD